MTNAMQTPLADDTALKREIAVATAHFHPLEVIPWFRRFPHSFGRDFLYTFIWSTLMAMVFLLFAAMFSGRMNIATIRSYFFISNIIGYSIHFLFFGCAKLGLEVWVLERGKWSAVAYYTLTSSLGVLLGFTLASGMFGLPLTGWLARPGVIFGIAVNSFIISLIIGVIYFWRERSLIAEMRLAKERERMAQMEREATLANLRALQAQIEPHFLFNTLANVVGLIHPAPDTAKHMLEQFIAYLRATLAATREQETTLGKEFELMSHFLALLQVRMGDRLKVSIELPGELAGLVLPSMLLQPLVENAIKHGLEPKVEGGTIMLRAARKGDLLKLSVIDTGIGFSGATSAGLGLRNVRERVVKLFDGKGSMIIEENLPSGTRVELTIPAMANASTGAAVGALLPDEARQR